jgi:copper chaperone CopZ
MVSKRLDARGVFLDKVIIYIILALVLVFAVWGVIKRIRHGSSCCGEHEAAPKKIRTKDTNKSHYPFVYELDVDGMHCANCARRVENGFNSVTGLWAKADIGQKKVTLRSKTSLGETQIKKIISDAGYTLLRMRQTNL